METNPLKVVLQQLVADGGLDDGGMTDGELLTLFLSSRDDNALAALVWRHAPMVIGHNGYHINPYSYRNPIKKENPGTLPFRGLPLNRSTRNETSPST